MPLTRLTMAMALAVAYCAAHESHAVVNQFRVDFDTLNNSGVTGSAMLQLDTDTQMLTVEVMATGLEADQMHPMHIHGLLGGDGSSGSTPVDSTSPTLADDTDGDGFVEVFEGVPKYGDILLTLGSQPAPGGVLSYSNTFDLTDDSLFGSPVTGADYVGSDLLPLDFREIVIHGLTLEAGQGLDNPNAMDEADGTAGYKAVLPVASGAIVQVPEPASALLALFAVVGVAGAARYRR